MKLTETRIKQIILEEIIKLSEQDPQPEQESQPSDQTPADQQSGSYTTSDLKKELVSLGQKIQTIPGLDSTELKLISGIIGFVVKVASNKSAGTQLKKIYDLLERFNEA